MNYNDEETPKLNLGKEKRMANANSLPVAILSVIGCALVVALIFFIFYKPDTDISSKVEISLNVSDVKIVDKETCEPDKEAIKDAQNVKLSYKQSEKKYYYGDQKDLLDENFDYKEPSEDQLRNGVELVVENLTDKVYLYVEYSTDTSDADGRKYTYDQSENGRITLPFNAYKTNDVSVYVYSADENCDRLLKHYDVVLPRYNDLYTNSKCSSKEGKESKYCVAYTYDKFDESVLNKLGEAKKEESKIDVISIAIVFVLFIVGGVVIFIKLR